jgi:hypothetical protein
MNEVLAILNIPLLSLFLISIVVGVIICVRALRDARKRLETIALEDVGSESVRAENVRNSIGGPLQQRLHVSTNAKLGEVPAPRAGTQFAPQEWARAAAMKEFAGRKGYDEALDIFIKAYDERTTESKTEV